MCASCRGQRGGGPPCMACPPSAPDPRPGGQLCPASCRAEKSPAEPRPAASYTGGQAGAGCGPPQHRRDPPAKDASASPTSGPAHAGERLSVCGAPTPRHACPGGGPLAWMRSTKARLSTADSRVPAKFCTASTAQQARGGRQGLQSQTALPRGETNCYWQSRAGCCQHRRAHRVVPLPQRKIVQEEGLQPEECKLRLCDISSFHGRFCAIALRCVDCISRALMRIIRRFGGGGDVGSRRGIAPLLCSPQCG